MNIFRFLFKSRECTHKNALLKRDEGYCPDCGAYLKKNFYVVRCKHCDIKRISVNNYGEIEPASKYCENCGGSEYYVEKLERINFFDIKYVVFKLEEILTPQNDKDYTQIWVDNVEEGEFGGFLTKKVAP